MIGNGYQEIPPPSMEEMAAVFIMCRKDHWSSVLHSISRSPKIATTPMVMDNHIVTTVMHQAITSKGDVKQRAEVILKILKDSPDAAKIKNGYGSLPLHVIAQRNTKIDAKTKEMLIHALVKAYPEALAEEGGVGKRTPLHIIFTDYISPSLTETMIGQGVKATFMTDKKGYLPAHVACSRHCSPQKLAMLLEANPSSLWAETEDGHTLLSLATSTATKSHPNFRLIDALKKAMNDANSGAAAYVPVRVSSDDTNDSHRQGPNSPTSYFGVHGGGTGTKVAKKKKKDAKPSSSKRAATRKTSDDEDVGPAADLLLHFSRHGSPHKKVKTEPAIAEFAPSNYDAATNYAADLNYNSASNYAEV